MRLLLAATLVALVLVLPASASASTAAVRDAQLVYRAAPGEVNDVLISTAASPDGSSMITVSDPGATIAAGDGCAPAGAHAVSCLHSGSRADVDLSDGNDRARLSGLGGRSVVRGGPGDDHLIGWVVSEDLRGGPGDDLLEGGDGIDFLHGGGGRDRLLGQGDPDIMDDGDAGAPGPDVLDGGDGAADSLSYADRSRPVRVDLGRETGQGQAGEDDTVRGVEQVTGGRAGDTLFGDEQFNRLDGGPGPDRIRGGLGDDTIVAGAGDRVTGDRGDDVFEATARTTASIACGRGRDVIGLTAYARERLGSGPSVLGDCESLKSDPSNDDGPIFALQPQRITRSGRISFRVSCQGARCRGRLALTRPGAPFRRLVSTTFRSSRDHPDTLVTVRLPRAIARRAHRRAVEVRVRITGVADDPLVWRLKIRVP